jgi:hypothetical protein
MNNKQWNSAMFSAIAALAVVMVPFLAASDFDFGGDSDFDFGGDTDFDFGGDSDFDFGGDSDFNFGGDSPFDPGGDSGDGTPVGGDPFDGPGWDPFDDDDGPFTGIPGIPPGPDVIPDPDPDDDGCIVNCNPTPTPTPGGNDDDDDHLRIFINNIFLHDPFSELPGNQVELRVTFENDGNVDLDDTKVIVMIPDLSVRDAVGPFDLDSGEKMTKLLFLDLPEDTEPGVYPVRLQVYNEARQRIVHREIEVIDYS